MGTPWYVAPEVVLSEQYSFAADIWSIGCVALELLTGTPPWSNCNAVAALARKLTVAVWYLMMGRWTPVEQIDTALIGKVSKMITGIGPTALRQLGKTRKAVRTETYQALKGRIYVLDDHKKFEPKPKITRTLTLADEYGLR